MTDLCSHMSTSAEDIGSTPDHPVGSARPEQSADLGPQSEEGRGCRRPRVVILTNIPAPYRVHQFAQLAGGGRYDYLIYFCASSEPNRQWRRPESYGFRHEILNARPHTFLGGYSYFIPSFFVRLLRERPRVVIVGGFSLQLLLARLYGRLRRAGVIVMNDSNILYERDLPAWRTALRRLLVRGIDGGIGCSRLGMDYLHGLGVPADRIALSRCVNDAVSFSEQARAFRAVRAEDRRRLGLPGEALVLLYVGRFESRKGIIEMIEAFVAARADGAHDLHLLLVGDGSMGESLRRIVTERSLSTCVTFAGFSSYEEMPRFYALADLAVIPTLRECYSLVVNEAIAARIPVLCSIFAGARDLLEDGCRGLLFNPLNVREFADVIADGIRRVQNGGWRLPVEMPCEILPETANAAIEDLLDQTIRSTSGGDIAAGITQRG